MSTAQGRRVGVVASRRPDRSGEGPLLEVRDLYVRLYRGDREVRAVNGVSYSVTAGKTLAIVGESGSGKTVSCRAVMGLLPRTAVVTGSARLEGQELLGISEPEMREHLGTDVAMVFQDPARSLNPTMRVGLQITEAIREHLPLSRGEAHDRAVELLERVRMPLPGRRFHEYPHQLSGGMRQRVMIAIALACHPKLLIADEATTALDVTTQAQIMELLLELQQDLGMALIFITHDLSLAASIADEVMVMYAGRAVERGPTRELFARVRMPYTRALLDAIPRLHRPAHSPLPVVTGQAPPAPSTGSGCAFASRCPNALDRCLDAEPPLEEHEPRHLWACWNPCQDESAV
ncbi:MAG: ABC transporter ATP-binding protein [Candidatus Dormibacteraeota bacterium]|nr:ABC transporter ATP-binding protein [Candidatus Dormibacteraeota bacterium]